ncbi:J domain-containing protein [Paraburkholderia ginsengisoli]|uniref:J domain-containing protein n=1 Tax=Paraburkholderia ginsengisoli TaxID=311231 RepID=A0A7T4TAY6_9BURK|nr:J domain-containing protein [Paraburkholderia ginsengisoli]QQC65930.1 J domain-containing protein [Paraburkholderia ginsengisoli]
MTTLYDTLGVHAHATDDEIKRAYRKAAMKWHPDRNSGAEEVARAAFQEIKDAYAILSDAGQRKVYDAVYAEQMRGWEAQRARQQQAQARREAAARAADEAAYAEMVSVAIRFADDGHNRDVLFGVLLGRQCEPRRAAQIADSVAALQASRREAAKADATGADAGEAKAEAAAESPAYADAGAGSNKEATAQKARGQRNGHPDHANQANHATRSEREEPATDAHPAGSLSGLWFQFLNGLRF